MARPCATCGPSACAPGATDVRKAQARRLALWVNGIYLIGADHTGFGDGELPEGTDGKLIEAQMAIGLDMIARSGIPRDVEQDEAIRMVLANERI